MTENSLTPIMKDGKIMRVKKRQTVSKTPEGKVKDKIKKLLDETEQCYWFMPVASGYNKSGVPDIIACVNGVFVAIEAKSNKTSHPVTALQRKNLLDITYAKGIAVVIDEGTIGYLEQIIKYLAQGGTDEIRLEQIRSWAVGVFS